MERTTGAWIFISHSHLDLKEVRKIRNYLESLGHNPILFFLKSIKEEDELESLIKREIRARNWFILCQSSNTAKSKFVQKEVEFINSLEGKIIEVIDLSDNFDLNKAKLNSLSKKITVSLSYTTIDMPYAKEFTNFLINADYSVIDYHKIPFSPNFKEDLKKHTENIINSGHLIVLLSSDALDSFFLSTHLEILIEKMQNHNNIHLICIKDYAIVLSRVEEKYGNNFRKSRLIDFTKLNLNKAILSFIENIKI